MSRPPLPVATEGALRPAGPSAFSRRERDYLLLTIFVLTRHNYLQRAGVLAEALYLMGEEGADVLLARAVLRFVAGEWAAALACIEELDRADPIERFGSYRLTERQRMRRYLKTRCLYELDDLPRARDAMEAYLRHGQETGDEPG